MPTPLENAKQELKIEEILSQSGFLHIQEQLRLQQPYFDKASQMLDNVRNCDPQLVSQHPLAATHPDYSTTHVMLISVDRSPLCQAPLDAQIDYVCSHYLPKTTVFTPVGQQSHNIVGSIHGRISNDEQLPSASEGFLASAIALTDFAERSFLQNKIGSFRMVHIQKNLSIKDTELLPVYAQKTDTRSGIIHYSETSITALSELLHDYLSAVIYKALLETAETEHFTRMTTAHRLSGKIYQM